MPVTINHTTSSYLPVTSPSKTTSYRHHCSPTSYKSSYSTLTDKYSYPSRYSSYSRTTSLSDDSGLSITGTSCTRDRSTDSQESVLSRYSKVRSSSSSDSTSSALKSYSSSTLSRKSTPSSRYLSDYSDTSVADIRLRFSSLPKTDSSRPTKLSESRSYSRSESLQPLALSSRKSTLSTTLEQSSGLHDEVNDENHNYVNSGDEFANLNESIELIVISDDEDYDQVVPTDEPKLVPTKELNLVPTKELNLVPTKELNLVVTDQENLSNLHVEQPKGVGKSIEDLEIIYEKRKAEEDLEPANRAKCRTPDIPEQSVEEDRIFSKGSAKGSSKFLLPSHAVPEVSSGLIGLKNIGNTCFLNSIVQCLSNIPELRDFLITGAYLAEINSDSRGALIKSFADVIKNIWTEGKPPINTTTFKSQVHNYAPRFLGNKQQDGQEFLSYLLAGLHEDLNRVKFKPRTFIPIDENLSEQQKAIETWKQYLRTDNSKIVDLFVGQLLSTLKCSDCGHCSTCYEPFWDLSLPVPSKGRNITLNQCLELFTKKETLDGNEMPTCSNCKVRRKCTKAFSFQKLPSVLVLHLKRFSPERERGCKLTSYVDFPITNLDMSPYVDASVRGKTPLYNLYGVSNHVGLASSGHYTAHCYQPHHKTWFSFNDTIVKKITESEIVTHHAYLLFYIQSGRSS